MLKSSVFESAISSEFENRRSVVISEKPPSLYTVLVGQLINCFSPRDVVVKSNSLYISRCCFIYIIDVKSPNKNTSVLSLEVCLIECFIGHFTTSHIATLWGPIDSYNHNQSYIF